MSSGDTLQQFFPADNEPPVSINGLGFATLDTRNSVEPINCLNFPVSIQTGSQYTGLLPRYYAGGAFTVQYVWSAASVGTGAVVWAAAAVQMASNFNVSATPFTYSTTILATVSASTPGLLVYSTIALSVPAFVSGNMFRLSFDRVGSGTGDNMAGAAQLYSIEIKES